MTCHQSINHQQWESAEFHHRCNSVGYLQEMLHQRHHYMVAMQYLKEFLHKAWPNWSNQQCGAGSPVSKARRLVGWSSLRGLSYRINLQVFSWHLSVRRRVPDTEVWWSMLLLASNANWRVYSICVSPSSPRQDSAERVRIYWTRIPNAWTKFQVSILELVPGGALPVRCSPRRVTDLQSGNE